MITAVLTDQLGNMMFEYAAVKTIATTKGIPFRYVRVTNKLINSVDAKYGCELNTIFPIPGEEQLASLPENSSTYCEPPPHLRDYAEYPKDVYISISDNTIVRGFFITPELIEHNLDNIRKWFTLPESAISKSRAFLKPLRTNGAKICVVHFRVGHDYFVLGYKLHHTYWKKAAAKVLEQHQNVQFVCVYDKRTSEVESFMRKFPSAEYHGSLVDDMAMLTQADINIVCNSSFSIMGALLNPSSVMSVCPSIYPTPAGNLPDNTFAKSWIRIPDTKRNLLSHITWTLRKFLKTILPIKLIKRFLNK